MSNLLINFEHEEAEALAVLLNSLSYDDVATIIERTHGVSPEISEEAFKIWDVADNLHRILIDHGYEVKGFPQGNKSGNVPLNSTQSKGN